MITKAQRMLAYKPTEFATGLRETYKCYLRERQPAPLIDFSFEDQILSRFGQQSTGARSA